MDLKVFIGTSLAPQKKTVSKDKTVRDLLVELNIAFQDGQVTLNGGVLGTRELNQTLNELNVKDGDYILAVSKHTDGIKPL